MYSLFDLFSNKFCIINSETHNYFKEEAFTSFHNQSPFDKSPVVGYFYSTEFEINGRLCSLVFMILFVIFLIILSGI